MKIQTYYKITIILLVCIILFTLYKLALNNYITQTKYIYINNTTPCNQNPTIHYGNGDIWPPDIVNNKYAAPLKDTRSRIIPNIEINIPTNIGYVNTSYRQLGVLTPIHNHSNSKNELLILMGRPLYVNRNKWQYYAISDQRNSIKLPIVVKCRDALNEYGVDELYNLDVIYVKGYNNKYRIDMYEQETPQYIPYVV